LGVDGLKTGGGGGGGEFTNGACACAISTPAQHTIAAARIANAPARSCAGAIRPNLDLLHVGLHHVGIAVSLAFLGPDRFKDSDEAMQFTGPKTTHSGAITLHHLVHHWAQ
jgi:hypothetical protein